MKSGPKLCKARLVGSRMGGGVAARTSRLVLAPVKPGQLAAQASMSESSPTVLKYTRLLLPR